MTPDQSTVTEAGGGAPPRARAALFVSDNTGITAKTLGSALPANLPGLPFGRHTIPFVDTVEGARAVARDIQRVIDAGARVPFLNSSTKSVEEMSAVIMQSMRLRS